MKKITLIVVLLINYSALTQTNLVTNGNMEDFFCGTCTPDFWSTASDFGDFLQNTTDFTEGSSSVQFVPDFRGNLKLFTTADIALQAGVTYTLQLDYKYLGTVFDASRQLQTRVVSSGITAIENTIVMQNNDWNQATFEITPIVSDPDYALELLVTADTQILVDDVKIFAGTLGTTNFLKDKIHVFPTLVRKGWVNIKTPTSVVIKDIKLYTLLGKAISLPLKNTIDLSGLPNGIYILSIKTQKGYKTQKIVIGIT